MLTSLRHEKTGHLYGVVGFGIDEAALIPVVYRPVDDPDTVWTRPCSRFFDGRFRQTFVVGKEGTSAP